MGDAATTAQSAWIAAGLAAHREGDHERAARLYDAVLDTDPQNADALHLRGALAMQQGELERAHELIARAIAQRPANAAFRSNQAIVCRRLGRLDEAVGHAREALTLNGATPQIHRVLGQCLAEAGDMNAALQAYSRANHLDRSHRPSIDAELDCLMTLGRYPAVLARIRAFDLEPDDGIRFRQAQALRALGKHDEAWGVLQGCDDHKTLLWQLNALKHHLECGDEAEAIVHGQIVLKLKERLALERRAAPAVEETAAWPERAAEFRPCDEANPDRNLVCFSLWGAKPKYTINAVRNAERVPRIYPGWRACFYVDESVPEDIRTRLAGLGAKIVLIQDNEPRQALKAFWRFFAGEEPGVERFICRDCDALVNEREAAAVAQWLESGRLFHVMRDHPEHAELIMAGMWGGVGGLLGNLSGQALHYYHHYTPRWHWMDQDFLRDCVWPLIRHHCLVHDDRYRMGACSRPFPPVSLPRGAHVGGYFPEDDSGAVARGTD